MVVTLTGVAIPVLSETGQPESCPASATIILCGSVPLNMGMLTYDNKKRRLARLLSPITICRVATPVQTFFVCESKCNHPESSLQPLSLRIV